MYTIFLLFAVKNKIQFWMHSEIYSINTRNNFYFYQQLSHLTVYQQSLFYMVIKEYNSLHNIKKFKSSLSRFLHQHSFYTLEKYLNYKPIVYLNY
jgi:hypothetical protein